MSWELENEIRKFEEGIAKIDELPRIVYVGTPCHVQYPDGDGWYLAKITGFKKTLFGVKDTVKYELRYGGYDIDGGQVVVTSSMINDYLNSYNRLREQLKEEKRSSKKK